MPTINISKTVAITSPYATGVSFTATATQGSNVFPLTATYTAPNLVLTSSGSVGVSGNFTFNITASYTVAGQPCTDSISFTESISNNFTNLRWSGNLPYLGGATPFDANDAGFSNYGFNFVLESILKNEDNASTNLTLLPGNSESIFEFNYISNSPHTDKLDGNIIAFTHPTKSFGISNGGHCGFGGAMQQLSSFNSSSVNYGYTINLGANCNSSLVSSAGYTFNVGYVDTTYYNTSYPKTKFKFRTINGNFELYKNDVLVGTLPYDNTVNYYMSVYNFNYNSGFTNSAMQLLKIEGNFQ